MLLVGKAACSGIVFILLTIGVSGPRPTPLVLGASLSKEVLAVRNRNDVRRLQQTLQDEGNYRGEVDGVFGLRTQASIHGFQKAQNLPVTGQLLASGPCAKGEPSSQNHSPAEALVLCKSNGTTPEEYEKWRE
jgi:peptidoglycan hydrolase-like protein with peptidoglycan-binding domain